MKLKVKSIGADTKLQVASLIDVVFLLLIYFMVTATLIKKEGDLGFKIPAPGPGADLPIEVFIEIQADGVVAMDGIHFDSEDTLLGDMSRQIKGLKQIANNQGAKLMVNLVPHKRTRHGRIVDVMDACAKAGVGNLGFADSI